MTILPDNASLFVCNDRARKRIIQDLFFRFGGSCYKCPQQLDINESGLYPSAVIVLVSGERHPRKLCCPICAPPGGIKRPFRRLPKPNVAVRQKAPEKLIDKSTGELLPTIRRLFLAQDGKCTYCKTPTRIIKGGKNPPDRATIDHMTPRCRGGANNLENKTMACFECNNVKGSMTVSEFLNAVYLASLQLP